MIGYWIFGAPNILFAGFLTCFASIIPMVGNSAGMVSDSCLHGIDRQLGSSYRPGHLWRCSHFTARQPDTLHHPEEMADIHPLITVFEL